MRIFRTLIVSSNICKNLPAEWKFNYNPTEHNWNTPEKHKNRTSVFEKTKKYFTTFGQSKDETVLWKKLQWLNIKSQKNSESCEYQINVNMKKSYSYSGH